MISSDLCYVLHARPYRETSLLVQVFGRDNGRLSLVFKGARQGRRPPLQPFSLAQLSWAGKADLKTLRTVEVVEVHVLPGRSLYLGLYLNELLMRVLRDGQAVTPLFDRYHHLVQRLASPETDVEPLLRTFEYALLDQMGYGFLVDVDSRRGEAVIAGRSYLFDPLQGLISANDEAGHADGGCTYAGEHLLAMAAMDYSSPLVRSSAKRLMREALSPLLGAKPLMSRELFRGYISDSEAMQ